MAHPNGHYWATGAYRRYEPAPRVTTAGHAVRIPVQGGGPVHLRRAVVQSTMSAASTSPPARSTPLNTRLPPKSAKALGFGMKTWVIVLLVYAAPPTAVDWPGPWTKGMVVSGKDFYRSEGECRNEAIKWIARVQVCGWNAGARPNSSVSNSLMAYRSERRDRDIQRVTETSLKLDRAVVSTTCGIRNGSLARSMEWLSRILSGRKAAPRSGVCSKPRRRRRRLQPRWLTFTAILTQASSSRISRNSNGRSRGFFNDHEERIARVKAAFAPRALSIR